jgi:hypothetical protein
VATRDLFSEDEFERPGGFPESNRAELIRYVTLVPADEMFVSTSRGRSNVLGAAAQLGTLPWQGSLMTGRPRLWPRWPGCLICSGSRSAGWMAMPSSVPRGELRDEGSSHRVSPGLVPACP